MLIVCLRIVISSKYLNVTEFFLNIYVHSKKYFLSKKKKKKKENKIRHLYLDHGMQLGKFKNYSKVSRLILIFYGS